MSGKSELRVISPPARVKTYAVTSILTLKFLFLKETDTLNQSVVGFGTLVLTPDCCSNSSLSADGFSWDDDVILISRFFTILKDCSQFTHELRLRFYFLVLIFAIFQLFYIISIIKEAIIAKLIKLFLF